MASHGNSPALSASDKTRNTDLKELDMELQGKRVAILAEEEYEDLELHYPRLRLLEAGAQVDVIGAGEKSYLSKKGYPAKVTRQIDEVKAQEYDAVVIPGGYSPDKMRRHRAMVDFVRAMHERGAVVAFICHAGWMAASAGILKGKTVTSFFCIKDDVVNAGAEWVDKTEVRDGNLLSSRNPG